MPKVKIYGAGSIGNHLAQASRQLGWDVHLCDIDNNALERTKTKIYPERYGQWDEQIQLYNVNDVPCGGYDYIFIGTPPAFHIDLAINALKENPKAVLIEKPVCAPNLERAQELFLLAHESSTRFFVGYDNILSEGVEKIEGLLLNVSFQDIETMDVEFREHWDYIFAAHPWLNTPTDIYIGFWEQGGGSCGEQSHALNLWQHFAHQIGAGRVVEVSAMLDYVKEGGIYDKLCSFNLKTEYGLKGRVVQDVITKPARKSIRIQKKDGYIEWQLEHKQGFDLLCWENKNIQRQEHLIKKSRPNDFLRELTHIQSVVEENKSNSSISLERGLDTMLVIAAAHLSEKEKKKIHINYSKGYSKSALQLI